jgi:hypothetical protein
LERTTAVDWVRSLKRATLQRTGALDGAVILQRAIALCIGPGDRPVVAGVRALQRAIAVLRTIVLRIGTLERTHGALRLLWILIVALLLLAGRLRERRSAAEQHECGHDTLRF